MPTPEIHRRQWVLGPEPVSFGERWSAQQIEPGLVLSWQAALPVRRLADGSLLLGVAVATQPGTDGDAGAHAAWSGRWALVADGLLVADAGALLGPFVRRDADRWWASSSGAILAQLPPAAHVVPDRPLRQGEPMDWYAPPASRWAEVARMLPSQALSLAEGKLVPRPSSCATAIGSGDDPLGEASARLVAAWRALARLGPAWLPLTAGHDSRLLLAAAVAAGVPVTTYTFDNPAMSRADRDLPPRLARRAGVEHRLIPPAGRRRAVQSAFDRHVAGLHAGVDRRYLARGQWDAIPAEAMVVRGGAFETARAFYHAQLPALETPSSGEMRDAAFRAFALEERHGARRQGVATWATWAAEHPWPAVDWRDRFYLEQRVGGWLAALEQALDLAAPDRVHLASGDAVLGALLSVPAEDRAGSRHHEELVRRLAPELLELPFNPAEPGPRTSLATRARIAAGGWRRRWASRQNA